MKAPSPNHLESSTTVRLRLPGDIKAKLAALARQTRRSRSSLANEAITAYVEREAVIVSSIGRGLADAEAGRVTRHEEAMRQLRATIADVQKGR